MPDTELLEMASGFEDVMVVNGSRSDATIAIAVHSTRLGPALGGVRIWQYATADEGVADAMRLGRAMTYLCMSWDHRALDGAIAAQFLSAVRRNIEEWR